MLDREIVAAIVAGDADGLAAAYDRYAAPLHAFCCSLLTDPAGAAGAVQDTFIVASARLDRLHDPDLLRSWLFAVARNECHRRLQAWPGGGRDGTGDHTVDFGAGLERAGLPEVVAAAMTALTPDEREVIELSLRHDFDRDDLAATLGVSPGHARTLASRARRRLEKSLGALLAARSGRPYCARLDQWLEGWDGRMTAAARQRLGRHIRRCRACSGRKQRDLPAAMLLIAPPAAGIARELRQQALGLAASGAPDVAAYRAGVLRAAGPFGTASGFPAPVPWPQSRRGRGGLAGPPVPAGRLQGGRRPGRASLALGAAAVLAALCAITLEFGLHHHAHRQQLAAAPLGRQPLSLPQPQPTSPGLARQRHASPPARPGSPSPAMPSSTPTVSVSRPVPSAPDRPHGSRPPSTPPSTPPSSPPTTPPATPPTQAPGTLSVSPTSVTLGVSAGGGASSGSFTLTANGGAVSYSISVPPAYAGELAVSPGGSLASGASVTISVTWNSSTALDTSLTVDPGGLAVSVSYQPPAGGAGAVSAR